MAKMEQTVKVNAIPARMHVTVVLARTLRFRLRLFTWLIKLACWIWPGPVVVTLDVDEE